MKKVIIFFVPLVLLGGTYVLFINKNISSNIQAGTIDNIHGFSFTPPERWLPWFSASIIMDSQNADLPLSEELMLTESDIGVMQEFANKWTPEASTELVYIQKGSNIDAQTRDLSLMITEYSRNAIENSLAYGEVFLSFNEWGGVNYNQEEKNSDISEVKYINSPKFGKVKYSRIKNFEGYDHVTLSIPISEQKHVSISKKVSKTEGDMLTYLLNFADGLEITNNTAQ